MGMQINVGDHVSSEADFQSIPNKYRQMLRWARDRANWVAKNKPAADPYYRTMSGRRSLTQLLADGSIWVNYHDSGVDFGYTDSVGGKEIAICKRAFRMGRWTVLATLVHELAHSNGAPNQPSKEAEEAVLVCAMGNSSEKTSGVDDPFTPYSPTISG